MLRRVAEFMAEATPTIDPPNCKRKNVEQSTYTFKFEEAKGITYLE